MPLLPTEEKTGEKSNKEEEQITFLINERDNKQPNSTAYGGVQAGRC